MTTPALSPTRYRKVLLLVAFICSSGLAGATELMTREELTQLFRIIYVMPETGRDLVKYARAFAAKPRNAEQERYANFFVGYVAGILASSEEIAIFTKEATPGLLNFACRDVANYVESQPENLDKRGNELVTEAITESIRSLK